MKLTKQQLFDEMSQYEIKLRHEGHTYIAGLDEVGRGPLAGPMCVAIVILNPDKPIYGLKDSKLLSKKQIKQLATEIKKDALEYAHFFITTSTIEKLGLKKALYYGFRQVVYKLKLKPDFILIDYEPIKFRKIPSLSITKGDQKSVSIAAASIIAKYQRDSYMENLAQIYPQYGFEKHVGYGTKEHLHAIEKYGIIRTVHRLNFKPIIDRSKK